MSQMWLQGDKGKRQPGKDKSQPSASFYVLRNVWSQVA